MKLGESEIRPEEVAENTLEKLGRVLLDGLAQVALLLTPDGVVLDLNRAALAVLEVSREQAAGRALADLLGKRRPDVRRQVRVALARAGEGEIATCEVELRRVAGDGSKLALQFALRPLTDEEGQVVFLVAEGRGVSDAVARTAETRMIGIVQDTGVHKAAEQDARRLAAIVESSEDAIVGKDLKGIVTSWNQGAERIFGYKATEMIGQPITKIIPPELYKDESRILATIARGERIEQFETVRLTKSGETVAISLTVSPVRDESGTIIGAAKIARDITQRKKVEQALRTTERLASVGRLAATVAHEINNPLEAVINLIYLARNAEGRDQTLSYLDMAEEELERISQLTKQTLGFYRETKGATGVRVGALVDSLLSIFAPRMRSRSIKLTTSIVDDVEICAIPGEIRQVVANLLSNSIDALDAGGEIRMRVLPATRWNGTNRRGVRLTVADNGGGIPADIRSQLFEPFFTTKKDVGTGLGLWICKSIVENHQGSIQVRSSTARGKSGTVFSVFLPVAAQEAIAPTPLMQ